MNMFSILNFTHFSQKKVVAQHLNSFKT